MTQRIHRLLGALVAYAVINAVLWSLLVPPGVAPDEQAHIQLGTHVARTHSLPTFGETEGFGVGVLEVGSDGRQLRYAYSSYAAQPPLAYLLAAPWIALPSDSVWMDYHQARVPQALLLGALVLLTYLVARTMFPGRDPMVALVAAVLVATWPQVSYLAAYFNADMLAATAGALVVWSGWRGYRSGWRDRDAILFGVAWGVAVLAKLNVMPVVGLVGLACLTTLPGPVSSKARRVGCAVVSMLAVCGWWLALGVARYGWRDPLALDVQARMSAALDADVVDGASLGWSFPEFLAQGEWIHDFTSSFVLGIPDYDLGPLEWIPATALVALSIFGGIRLWRRRDREGRPAAERRLLVATVALPVVLVVSTAVNAWRNDVFFLDQGRYAFPALVVFAVLVARALVGITTSPTGARRLGVVVAGAGVAWNLAVLLTSVAPEYGTSLGDYLGHWEMAVVSAWVVGAAWFACELVGMARASEEPSRHHDGPAASGA